MHKKVLTTVYLDPADLEFLKRLSRQTHVPLSVYIREGVALVAEKHAGELKATGRPS